MLNPMLSQTGTIDKQIKDLVDEFGNDANGIYILESALCIAAGIRPEIREENGEKNEEN